MRSKPVLFLILFIFSCKIKLQAQEQQPVPVFPGASFNKHEAGMLNNGTATLHGIITKKSKNPDNTYLGIVVTLFPCAPYFDEWYDLQKKNKRGTHWR